jgi:hypothetical protein
MSSSLELFGEDDDEQMGQGAPDASQSLTQQAEEGAAAAAAEVEAAVKPEPAAADAEGSQAATQQSVEFELFGEESDDGGAAAADVTAAAADAAPSSSAPVASQLAELFGEDAEVDADLAAEEQKRIEEDAVRQQQRIGKTMACASSLCFVLLLMSVAPVSALHAVLVIKLGQAQGRSRGTSQEEA